jgi:hypothetical protein
MIRRVSYKIRFVPWVPVLMIVFAVAVTVPLVYGVAAGVGGGNVIGLIFWIILIPWLILSGIARLRRAARSDWTALELGPDGVRLGARPGAGPASLPWPDVREIVVFGPDRKSSTSGRIWHVGVALRPDAPGGIGEFERRAREELARGDHALDSTPERLSSILDGLGEAREHAVSAYLRQRDWSLRRGRLESALAKIAPDVPLVVLDSTRRPQEWLEDRDFLDELAEDRTQIGS